MQLRWEVSLPPEGQAKHVSCYAAISFETSHAGRHRQAPVEAVLDIVLGSGKLNR
jgi:hypothetical protein